MRAYLLKLNNIIIFLIGIFVPILVEAACSGSSPIWTCTADSTSTQINSCISATSNGDIINFGAGSGTWATKVIITKGLHFKGVGSGSTTITNGVGGFMLQIDPTNQELNEEFEITGFTFNSGDAETFQLGNDCTDLTTFQTKVNIHDNIFTGSTTYNGNNHYLNVRCTGGVVWRNTFNGADQHITSNGYGIPEAAIWSLVPNVLGSQNALFIEDNVFTMTYIAESASYIKDSQFGASRIVWRYNTFILNRTQDAPLLDWHGHFNNINYSSSYGDEVYGNNVSSIAGTGAFYGWSGARGGKGVVFYNNAQTSGTVTNGNFSGEGNGGAGSCGPAAETLLLYNWVNTKNLNTVIITDPSYSGDYIFTCDGIDDYAKLNWNVFQHYTGFDGSAGMGCGSSLPSPIGYAERVGYWVTPQSCSSVSGLVGDIVNNPSRGNIAGDLYQIQSEAWVKIYSPYTYPHPLRGEASPVLTGITLGAGVGYQ